MNLSDIHAELYRNLSIIANDKQKMQKLLDLSHQLADSTKSPCSDENTDLDDSGILNDDDRFNIFIDIEGSDTSSQEIFIDPYLPIRKLRDEIVKAFNLPSFDNWENPIQYLLGLPIQDEEDAMILDFEDENGREQCILDYAVKPGDRFILLSVPLAGGGRQKMETRYLPKKNNIFQRIFNRKSDLSYASAFVPDTISRGNSMMIQVYLYSDGERDTVCAEATQCDHLSSEKAFTPLQAKLKKGDQISIQLRIRGLYIERSEKTIIWQGDYTKVCFHAKVSENWKDDRLYGEIFISINSTMIGELDFITDVTSEDVEFERTANVISRQYKKIFISYAHQDEDKVKYIAEGYRAQGINYFFDRHYLKGGDIYPLVIQEFIKDADLFLLCWSENAANSDYVQKERAQALQLAFPNVQPSEKATLTIYPLSIEPHALLPEDMRDYYNFIEI